MIIKTKVKEKEQDKGEEIEFRGPDALEQAIIFLRWKYGITNVMSL